MRHTVIFLLALGLSAGLLAQASPIASPDVLLKAAMQKEQIDNDLPAAIAQYQAIVDRFPKDPSAARALLQMAGIHQAQGDEAIARTLLERIVRDFDTVKEKEVVGQAAARLSRLGDGPTDRSIGWPGTARLAGDAALSPDGRYVTYVSLQGDLFVRDLRTMRARQLTTLAKDGGFVDKSAVSRSGKFVAVIAADNEKDRQTRALRILPLVESDKTPPRLLVRNGLWVQPRQWSADDTHIVVVVLRDDRSSDIGLVTVRDGSLRLLPGPPLRGLEHVSMSPDGSQIAYDVRAAGAQHQDIYLLPTDGRPAVPALVGPSSDQVIGWSTDGRHLIFSSNREGSIGLGLWAQAVAQGTATGSPLRLKAAFKGLPVGLTVQGSLMYEALSSGAASFQTSLLVSAVDPERGTLVEEPRVAGHDRQALSLGPQWSDDGRTLMYAIERPMQARVHVIRSEAGIAQEIPRPFTYVWSYDISPDTRTIVFCATDLDDRSGVFLMEIATGAVTPILLWTVQGEQMQPHFSNDGRSLVYVRNLKTTSSIVERNLRTGEERELLAPRPGWSNSVFLGALSPDRRFVWDVSYNTPSTIGVINLADGSRRELFRVERSRAIDKDADIRWLPDGSALIAKVAGAAPNERAFWWIPIDGRTPHMIDVGRPDLVDTAFGIHPDGRQIAFVAGDPILSKRTVLLTEFRMLERFLPKQR